MDKDKIIQEYFEFVSRPEELWRSHDDYKTKLGIKEMDTFLYQQKMIKQLSLRPSEKKTIVIKEQIKPMLKAHGFTTGGNTWCKKIDGDLKIIINMEGNRFSDVASGSIFGFTVSLFESKDKPKPQFGVGELSIDARLFLPYYGMLSPLYDVLGYRIDGYRDYLPIDTPIEEIKELLRLDFEDYILPELDKVNNRADYEEMYSRFCHEKRFKDFDMRLAWFIQRAQVSFTSRRTGGNNFEELVEYKKEMKLSKDDILDNLDLADKMRCHLTFTKIDVKPLLKELAEGE